MINKNKAITTIRLFFLAAMAIFLGEATLAAASPSKASIPAACASIEKDCSAAGFIDGDWGLGIGLWFDCIDPIMQGQTMVPGASKAPPKVDPAVVASCKKQAPKFGNGQVGSTLPLRASLNTEGIIFPDLNMWHVVSNWDALAKASHGVVALKAWQSSVDRPITAEIVANFQENLRQAEKRGMIVIGYAFGVGGVSGALQADALLAVFHMGTPGHPVPGHILALDLERNPYGLTMTDAEAEAFVNRVHTVTGRYPILYSSEDVARPGVLGKCPRWVAAWGIRPASATIWQFTDGVLGPTPHSFPGVGKCDINKLLVTYGALRKLVGL